MFEASSASGWAACTEFDGDFGSKNFSLESYYRMCDELLEEIRRCMDPDEKHKLEKELQAAIYDAEDGSCLFGRVLYVNKSSMYKYDYVIDDHATEAFTACWDLSACWLNK